MYKFVAMIILLLAVLALALGCGGDSGAARPGLVATTGAVGEDRPTVSAGESGALVVEEPTATVTTAVAAVPESGRESGEQPGEAAVELLERLSEQLGLGAKSQVDSD